MANATKTDVINAVNTLIRNRCNSGVAWGSDSYPVPSIKAGQYWWSGNPATWFAGPKAGNAIAMDANNAAFSVAPNARQVTSAINAFIQNFAGIRMMRIVIVFRKTGAYNTTSGNYSYTAYDGTAVGYSNEPVAGLNTDLPPIIPKGGSLKLTDVQDYCNRLYTRYVSLARGNPLYKTATLCHTSCHGACHNSRGRR